MARRWVAAGRRDSIALARAAMEALSPCGLRLVATICRALSSEMSDCRTGPRYSQEVCSAIGMSIKTAYNKCSAQTFPINMAGDPLTADIRDAAEHLDTLRR
jgi:hypothetical protein